MKGYQICITGLLFVVAVFSGTPVFAGIETLVKPGKVIEGHMEYEEVCEKCHKPFSKESQSMLCRDCHEDIDADIRQQQGIHGQDVVSGTECKHCHSDHKGRKADIVQLDIETFKHNETDYLLKGAHRVTRCAACHVAGKKYRDAPHECIGCHEDDDIHAGRLGEECADCHAEHGWSRQEFNHDATDFVLREKHSELACDACHVNNKYKDIPGECYACHGLNDVHAGRYGQQCEECHSEAGWDRSRFDHGRDTDYPLTGKHREVKCDICHTGRLHEEKPGTDCVTCHRGDDRHSGRYGEKCHSCHTTRGWEKSKFDHSEETGFPLRGKHQEASCLSCHKGDVYEEKIETACFSCHGPDDVHRGQQGERCENCHSEEGWSGQVRFEHDMTSFPLLGLHAVTPCEECHLTTAYKSAASDCNACHKPDDVHERRLGRRCELCHNPNGWSLWEFDHNVQTEYELDGAHEGIDCLSCHVQEITGQIRLSSSCAACHRADDVHDGQFGRFCDRCHTTESFDAVEVR